MLLESPVDAALIINTAPKLTVPAEMASPIETSIGSDSPVIAAASTDPIPSTILPSTANR